MTLASLSMWRWAATRALGQAGVQTAVGKLVSEICCACGWRIARSVRSRWVMTGSTSGGRLLIALLVRCCSARHPALSCAVPAPMALEPGVAGDDDFTHMAQVVGDVPAASGLAPLDSAFMSCIRRVAASISSSSLTLLVLSRTAETTKDRHRCDNRGDVSEVGAFRRHRQHRRG